MEINCLAPFIDENLINRDILFGSIDKQRSAPKESHPYFERRQEDQGNSQWCTLYAFMEVLENKVFAMTGRWWQVPFSEYESIWGLMVYNGLATDEQGAYLNAPHKVLSQEGQTVLLKDEVSHEYLRISLKDYFYVCLASDPEHIAIDKLKKEIFYGGGYTTGLNSMMTGLDYMAANTNPYIIEKRLKSEIRRPIAHAIASTYYNDNKSTELFTSSGTLGENFGDNGSVYGKWKDYRSYFTPIGFTIDLL